MIAMTTNSSTNVKAKRLPVRVRNGDPVDLRWLVPEGAEVAHRGDLVNRSDGFILKLFSIGPKTQGNARRFWALDGSVW